MDSIVAHFPEVRLNDQMAYFVRQGQAVLVPEAPSRGWVRLYAKTAVFVGLGEVLDDGRIAPRRLVRTGGDSPALAAGLA
jgi:tRNA pseudouridine55 synthase